jgi:DNA-binding beta-propeller fold protein YncE
VTSHVTSRVPVGAGIRRAAQGCVAGWEWLAESEVLGDVSDVAVDADDRVFLLTRGDPAVVVCAPDGVVVNRWGSGVFTNPHGLTVAPDGSIFCADIHDHTVRRFTADGVLLATFGVPGRAADTGYRIDDESPFFTTVTRSGPPFHGPTKVCALADGSFYVADGYGNARVHRFGPDGELVGSWGEPGSGPGQFRVPHGITATPREDRLLVCDRENGRIQVFDRDGRLLDIWPGLHRPCAAVVAPDGRVYVAELGGRAGIYPTMTVDAATPWSTCAVLDDQGRVLARWGTDNPATSGSFFAAHGIALDSTGAVYLAEVSRAAGLRVGGSPPCCHAMQKFRPGSALADDDGEDYRAAN